MATSPKPATVAQLAAAGHARWASLSHRERRLILLAAAVLGLAFLWLVLLRPALQTLRAAPAEIAQLQDSLRTVQAQAQDLAALAAAPAANAGTDDLRGAISSWLHSEDPQAKLQITALPGSAALDVKDMKPQTLLALAQAARRNWGATIAQAQLTQQPDGLLSGRVQLARQQGASTP